MKNKMINNIITVLFRNRVRCKFTMICKWQGKLRWSKSHSESIAMVDD